MDPFSELLAGSSTSFEAECGRRTARDQNLVDAAECSLDRLKAQFKCGQITHQQLTAESKKKQKLNNGHAATKVAAIHDAPQIQPVIVQLDMAGDGNPGGASSSSGGNQASSSSTTRSLPFKTASSTASEGSDWLISEIRNSRSSMPHLIRLYNDAIKKPVNSKQNKQVEELTADPERFERAVKKVTMRPGSTTEDCRVKAYIRCMVNLGKHTDIYKKPFPARAILLEEIVDIYSYDKLLAAVVSVGFFAGLRRNTILKKVRFGSSYDHDDELDGQQVPDGEDPPSDTEDGGDAADLQAMTDDIPPAKLSNSYDHWCGDFFYNERSENFCLDLEGHVLKSNLIRKVYVKCLCKHESAGIRNLCFHNTLEIISKTKKDFRKSFIKDFSEYFGTTRTQSMRVGCLQHLMAADIGAARVACHLRWSSNSMVSYYNRGNDYREHDYKDLKFIP
eukprot:g12545.t1